MAPPDGPPWFAGNRVSMHPSLVRADVRTSDGTTVGYSGDQTAGPGETVTYLWYADEITYPDSKNPATLTDGELGGVPLTEFGDVRGHRHHGLLAALVVGPRNATFHDQITGARVRTGASVDVHVPGVAVDYRDSVIIHHNGLNLRDANGNIIVDPIHGDEPDAGERGINYKNAPLYRRLGLDAPIQHVGANPLGAPFNGANWGKDLANAFSSNYEIDGAPIGDPDTPILRAYQGDPVRVHVLESGDRARMVETEISGHNWLEHAFDAGSVRAGVQGSMATGSAFTFYLQGAGGDGQNVGDYKYGVVHAVNGMSAGSWGILRVYKKPAPGTERDLTPLTTSDNPYDGGHPIQVLDQSVLGPDKVAPTVTAVDPVDGTTGVAKNAAVTVTFSESVKAESVTEQTLLLSNSSGDNVASRVTLSSDLRSATVTPVAPLAPGAVYTVGVSVAVTDLASNPLAAPFASTFTVIAPAVPGAPTSVVAVPVDGSAAGKGVIKVSWTAPSDNGSPIESYTVYGDNGTGCAVNAAKLSCDITGLTGGGSIAVSVTASNGIGEGLASEPVVATLLTKPTAPRNATAVAGDASALVSWKAPKFDGGSPITSYDVKVLDELGSPLFLAGCSVTDATSCTVTGLDNGVAYSFAIVAHTAVGDGKVATSPVVTPVAAPVPAVTVPDAPTNVTVVPVNGQPAGKGVVQVTWTAPKDNGSPILSYTVRYGDSTFGCMATETSCEIGFMTGGQSIAVRVVATNDVGDGPASADVVTTLLTKPPAPRKPAATAGDGIAVVSWKAPKSDGGSPITSYDVKVLDAAGSPLKLPGCSVTDATSSSCTVTGLTNGVPYSFAIVAQSDVGKGKRAVTPVVTPSAVPVAAAPAAPTLDAPVAGDGSVTVSWTPNSDGGSPITGYTVIAVSPDGTATCDGRGDRELVHAHRPDQRPAVLHHRAGDQRRRHQRGEHRPVRHSAVTRRSRRRALGADGRHGRRRRRRGDRDLGRPGIDGRFADHRLHRHGSAGRRKLPDDRRTHLHRRGPHQRHRLHVHRDGHQRPRRRARVRRLGTGLAAEPRDHADPDDATDADHADHTVDPGGAGHAGGSRRRRRCSLGTDGCLRRRRRRPGHRDLDRPGIGGRFADHRLHRHRITRRQHLPDDGRADLHRDGPHQRHRLHVHRDGHQRPRRRPRIGCLRSDHLRRCLRLGGRRRLSGRPVHVGAGDHGLLVRILPVLGLGPAAAHRREHDHAADRRRRRPPGGRTDAAEGAPAGLNRRQSIGRLASASGSRPASSHPAAPAAIGVPITMMARSTTGIGARSSICAATSAT